MSTNKKLNKKVLRKLVMEMITSLTEDEDKIVCPNCGHHNEAGVDKCSNCGHPRSKGSWKKAKAESLQEQEESYRMVKDPISGKRRMMRKSEYDDATSQLDDEFATAGGMEQDVEMRQKRGDFKQGDYGNVGPGGGETMDHGEYPWVKAALEDLKDDEFPDKEKALQALADELGISVKVMPSGMDSEPPMTEITKDQFNETLNKLIFVELAKIWGGAK
jgi:ribosomal protein L37AE/L43A